MSKWEMVKLGEVATLLNGRAYKQDELLKEGTTPVLRVGNFFSNRDWYYSDLQLEENKYCYNGDLLYAWSASFGPKIWDGPKAIFHYHIWKVVLTDRIEKGYMYYLLQKSTKEIKDQGNGIAMIHATKGGMEKMLIPLPPLETQKQIAKTLDTAAELLAMRKQQLAELDNLIKSTFYDMFGDPVANDKGWDMPLIEATVSKEKNAIKAGPFGSALKKEYYVKQGYKVYGQEQVINDNPQYGDYYISESKYKELENYAIKENDVLISLVGTYGKLIIIPKEFERGIINPRLMKITFDKSILNTTYFKYYFVSESLKNKLSEVSRGGTMDILNVGIVRKLSIPLPPLSLQNQFAHIVTKIEEQKALVQKAIDETQHLFDSLMSEYYE